MIDIMQQNLFSKGLYKEQIIKECGETGNVATQAWRYNISTNTIYTWIKKYCPTGSVKTSPDV